ncbi:protein prenyltransferase alpha subunit repeat-containing protein tempura [Oratosquilla oratoria]|uniref:protein prenyltransferase alpha subunit repeat-containing protein tempura n=1 Tax=Oratosquilla oratoria TaxID=337810 RepID=UPI003F75E91F
MEEATCERIINHINEVLCKDPLVDEFEVVVSGGDVNRCPVLHIDHKLGLESWCVQHVYSYAYAKIFASRVNKRRQDYIVLEKWTQFCLLVAPEVSTLWNIRKEMLLLGSITLQHELQVTNLILTRKAKCMEVFQHRKWMFHHMLNREVAHSNGDSIMDQHGEIINFLTTELNLCTMTATKHQNNYHSWNHRLWIMQQLEILGNFKETLLSEYEWTQAWVSVHVSEHSGLHYRQYILNSIAQLMIEKKINNEIFTNFSSVSDLYLKELELNRELIIHYEEHEALFCHRQHLLICLKDFLCSSPDRTPSPPSPAMKRSCIETVNEKWAKILSEEGKLIEICCKTNSYQQVLGKKHSKWITDVIAT